MLVMIGLNTFAQESPQQFFNKILVILKTKDTDAFERSFATQDQFKFLAFAYMHTQKVTQDSLDNADEKIVAAFRPMLRKVFSKILKQADSLHADLPNSQYVDCTFNEVKDTGTLCTSLTGTIYFKSGDRFYQMKLNEAVLIKNKWRIIDPGELALLNDAKFLSAEPNRISAFGNVSVSERTAKVKVVLQPPPPINKKPPPPPEPKRKKRGN